MSISTDELSKDAMGGTELMKYGLAKQIDPALLDKVQIICSRVRELEEDKPRILWLHDLPNDPESAKISDPEWRKQFDRIVCVSHWQMQQYNMVKGLPYNESTVLLNAIQPFEFREQETFSANKPIRLIYHSTPHRGLDILIAVFEALCDHNPDLNIELDVYSSFKLYGWEERDKQYETLYEKCRQHPKINYHGSQPNEVVRAALHKADIFAFPSIWPETSCLCLMEAMAAGCLCVHPNLAALPETAANWTFMYQYDEDIKTHANKFYEYMLHAIKLVQENKLESHLRNQAGYANLYYTWTSRQSQWKNLIKQVVEEYHGKQ